MSIKFDKDKKLFHLFNKNFSYYFYINDANILEHLYFGAFLKNIDINEITNLGDSWGRHYLTKDNKEEVYKSHFTKDMSYLELGSFGTVDKRPAPIIIKNKNNSYYTDFKFLKFKIYHNLEEKEDFPLVFSKSKVDRLELTLKEVTRDIYLKLNYVVLDDVNTIIRYVKIISKEEGNFLTKAMSFELDLAKQNYNLIHFYGDWSFERNPELIKINHGYTRFSSFFGRSGHEENPSIIYLRDDTNEDYGECFLVNLIYSGNFLIENYVDRYDNLRILCGINDEALEIPLEKNEEILLPQVALTYSNNGLTALSQSSHNFIREHVIRSKFVHKERPILLNSWEGCYLDFNTQKIKRYIEGAYKVGANLFVLDDGWFTNRNTDFNGLGDREIDKEKINLKELIDYAHSLNIKFGLWFEPEMINLGTELYKVHPEYALRKAGVDIGLYRHQLVLDTSNDEVIDYLINKISYFLDNFNIDYIKWDHNRYLADVYSKIHPNVSEGYLYHLITLGVYKLFNRLTKKYPDVLFEGCASGGGRFDLGMLYYTPQIWCSDETDPIQRTYIQYGTSFVYPLSTMGAHISKNQITSYKTKGEIALLGTYGLELNPYTLKDDEIQEIKEINGIFKEFHLDTVVNGDLYRLYNPFTSNLFGVNVVSKDKRKAILLLINYRKDNNKHRYIKFKGLDEGKVYKTNLENKCYSGDFLMKNGLNLSKWLNEFESFFVTLKEIDN